MPKIAPAIATAVAYLFHTIPGSELGKINAKELKRSFLASVGVTSFTALAVAILTGFAASSPAIFTSSAVAAIASFALTQAATLIARLGQGTPAKALPLMGTTHPEPTSSGTVAPLNLDVCMRCVANCPECTTPAVPTLSALPVSLDELERMIKLVAASCPRVINPGDFYRWFIGSFLAPDDTPERPGRKFGTANLTLDQLLTKVIRPVRGPFAIGNLVFDDLVVDPHTRTSGPDARETVTITLFKSRANSSTSGSTGSSTAFSSDPADAVAMGTSESPTGSPTPFASMPLSAIVCAEPPVVDESIAEAASPPKPRFMPPASAAGSIGSTIGGRFPIAPTPDTNS